MDEAAAATKVEWREWGAATFEEATDAGKPVLLSLSATWCSWCHEMDETTYSRPTIAANINERYVPVRVDVDRQPRVRERYNMGGFPSTVFVTPEGKVLTGATFLAPDGMRQILERVRQRWDDQGEEAGTVPRGLRESETPEGTVSGDIEAHVAGQLTDKFDQLNAGWGDDAKFPLPQTVEFALKRERSVARSTLDAIRLNLFDQHDGGFFRYASTQRWGEPHYEKLLATNAALVRAFANGYLYTGEEEYRIPASKTVDYLTTTLWNDDRGAFAGSQSADDAEEYYQRTADERADATPPSVDPTVFAGENALAVDALLTYHAYTDDERSREYAVRALSTLTDDLVEDGAVVHYKTDDEAGERGLLADHARTVRALTTAAQVLGDDSFLDTASTLADFTLDERRGDGAFTDGPSDGPGLLSRPLRPLDGNAELADALVNLSALTDEDRYGDAARDAVAAFAGATERLSVQVADYATAAARVHNTPLRIAVAADASSDLHRTALRVADHEKIVLPNATGEEFDAGNAYVIVDGEVSKPAATPDELSERVAELA